MASTKSVIPDCYPLLCRCCCSVRNFIVIQVDANVFYRGWDQTGSNGANLSFPIEFGINAGTAPTSKEADRDNWIVGLVNSAPYIASAFLCVGLLPNVLNPADTPHPAVVGVATRSITTLGDEERSFSLQCSVCYL